MAKIEPCSFSEVMDTGEECKREADTQQLPSSSTESSSVKGNAVNCEVENEVNSETSSEVLPEAPSPEEACRIKRILMGCIVYSIIFLLISVGYLALIIYYRSLALAEIVGKSGRVWEEAAPTFVFLFLITFVVGINIMLCDEGFTWDYSSFQFLSTTL